MTPSANVAASVRQRLLNRARADRRPFNELLQYYAMERFLYRLSKSFFSDRFILKGALLLRAWDAPEFRPTMDIDMLGKTSNEEADILSLIRNILIVPVEEDGLVFDSDSLQSERITEDADYEGIRVRFRGALDSARIVYRLISDSEILSILHRKKRSCRPCWIFLLQDCSATVVKAP